MNNTRGEKISAVTGIAIVIANMIGTGAFTSIGFQVSDLSNNMVILTLWITGGLMALAGAFSYAEVGTYIKKSGGEYAFLSEIYHPVVGYLAGWISLTAGFAAPIAVSAIAAVTYFPHGQLDSRWTGLLLVGLITFIHTRSIRSSAVFQNVFTILKVLLVVIYILLGLYWGKDAGNTFAIDATYTNQLFSPVFAVALIYVTYSYSGWNAAAYITEDFRQPRKLLPVALIGGTLIVMVLYTLLQFVFLKTVPVQELNGKIDIGVIAIRKIFNEDTAKLFGVMISFLLISGISAMVWVGSRVTASIAKEHALWRYFQTGNDNIPRRALWLQFGLTALLMVTGSFEQILVYCGFLLTLSSTLVVLGVLIIRRKNKSLQVAVFKSPLYPFLQLFYIFPSCWIMFYTLKNHTKESVFGLLNLLIGLIMYWVAKRKARHKKER